MSLADHIAQHLREVHFGGNWTDVSLKDVLSDLNWKEATIRVQGLHTISELVFHINYYISATLKVLNGKPLEAKDAYSFDVDPIHSKQDWDHLINKTWKEAEEFAQGIEKMSDKDLWNIMTDKKYGSYYRNLQGIIEHFHYHLGQIAIIKKIIREQDQ